MNWNEYTFTDQDYDLYLARDTGNVTPKWILVDSSTNKQLGGTGAQDIPQEDIRFQNSEAGATYGILVKNSLAAGTADFTLFSINQEFDYYVESSSLTDPGTVTDVVTVGAINRLVYNTTGAIESFSSRGPTTDGRTKPDVAAPDNCISHAYGYWGGTSLASPHTAGVCALIKSRFSSFSDTNTREYLYSDCTVDLGAAGKDNIYGHGKVVMPDLDITVTSPNGGENWYVDSTNNITWTSSGTSGGVKIEYSVDSGTSWSDVIVSMPDTGAYPWLIPNTPSDSCLVRVTDTNGSVSDTSDALFEISPTPYITVTSPNGGEDWEVDSTWNITWTSVATSGGIQIEYSIDSGTSWSDVIASMPDTGIYPWTIPNTPSDSCLVRITDTSGIPSDASDSLFEISPHPYITVTSPNGGENWYIDSTYNITWTSEGTSDYLFIDYSIDSGATWLEVTSYVHPDSGFYAWTIPNTPSTNCLVRIGDSASIDQSPSDTSDAIFTISPASAVPYSKGPSVYSMIAKTISSNNQFEVTYGLPDKANVTFDVYDIKGTKLGEISKEHAPGFYSIKINMSGKPAGVYLIRMTANIKEFTEIRKVILLK